MINLPLWTTTKPGRYRRHLFSDTGQQAAQSCDPENREAHRTGPAASQADHPEATPELRRGRGPTAELGNVKGTETGARGGPSSWNSRGWVHQRREPGTELQKAARDPLERSLAEDNFQQRTMTGKSCEMIHSWSSERLWLLWLPSGQNWEISLNLHDFQKGTKGPDFRRAAESVLGNKLL